MKLSSLTTSSQLIELQSQGFDQAVIASSSLYSRDPEATSHLRNNGNRLEEIEGGSESD